ncbi:MAG: hypothetical protein Q4B63_04585 [Clostridium perfringens]|nr:hypothetical protein [Clostridium perfringens]
MKVSIYIANKKYKASAYYRIVQYIDDMDIDCETNVYEFFPDWYYKINKKINFKIIKSSIRIYAFFIGYILRCINIIKNTIEKEEEIILIQGEIFLKRVPLGFKGLLKRYLENGKKIIWDFDSNIIKTKEISSYEFNTLENTSSLITVSHENLKALIDNRFYRKIKVVKTTDKILEYVNLYEVNKERLSYYNEEIVLLWGGTRYEIGNLKRIIPILDNLAKRLKYKNLVLKVVSDTKLNIRAENLIIENIKFSKKSFFKEMLKSHIAIMPIEKYEWLTDTMYLNLVQYIGTGLPIVLSDNNVGLEFVKNNNGYLASSDNDFEKLILYLTEKSIWKNKSNLSRKLWEDEFNSNNIKQVLEEHLSYNENF